MSFLQGLNKEQRQAVESDSPRILLVAGAGTGKTKTLTSRIAYLHQHRVGTSNMLALTFTRLAGKEMKERVMVLIGEQEGKRLFCNTFHAFCVQLIKEYGYLVGMDKAFTIYDTEDTLAILEGIKADFHFKLISVSSLLPMLHQENEDPNIKRVIDEYRWRLAQNNAIDLDGLLITTLNILKNNEKPREELRYRYQHIFVDEFQDTDDRQLEILKLINPENLFVVGDPDQSIYEWRGARPQNMVDFEKHFPGAEVIKLEQNYRSTKQIVSVANRSIYDAPHCQDNFFAGLS